VPDLNSCLPIVRASSDFGKERNSLTILIANFFVRSRTSAECNFKSEAQHIVSKIGEDLS